MIEPGEIHLADFAQAGPHPAIGHVIESDCEPN